MAESNRDFYVDESRDKNSCAVLACRLALEFVLLLSISRRTVGTPGEVESQLRKPFLR